ncbi:MAG: hypothetical protein Q9180_007514, partial [Flavoplaca navasiana]
NSPVQETHPAPQETPSAPTSDNSPIQETPSTPPPTSDNSPIQETPIASGVCPPTTCPPAVTSYITVTIAPSAMPSGEAIPSETPLPGNDNGAGIPADSGVNNPSESPVDGGSNVPSEGPIEGGSNIPSEGPVEGGSNNPSESPIDGGAGSPDNSAIPSTVDNSPVVPPFATGAPQPSGVAPIGTASTGGVFPGPTGAPITPFEGAASKMTASAVSFAGLISLVAFLL